ncbi:putative disease resistance protein RGA4 [Silene latifolia]|uniref:putative disease resistance protein RGA4 n=1 Tax=Silene latifolia TaxID=37657 RepID=UPI003D7787CC
MAETLGMKVAQGIMHMVLSRISEEIKLAWGFKKDLEKLKHELTRLEGLLQGADESSDNVLMNKWLKKVNNVVYEADDLLDDYAYEAVRRRLALRFRTGMRKKIRFFISSSNPAVFRIKMSHRLSDLMTSVDEIYTDAKDLGIKLIKVASGYSYDNPAPAKSHESEERQLRNRRQWVDEQGLTGRDTDIAEITYLVRNPNNMIRDLTVIGIVGLAGLGKTSLSKRISKADEVKEYFNSQIIWLVVSHDFNLTDILNKMAENLFGSASNMSDNLSVVEKIKERLKGKMYLLVLDDVWNSTLDWEPLRCALQEVGGSKGTCILTTSRTRNAVAKMESYCYAEDDRMSIQEPFIYQLQGLGEEESWSLFEKRVGHEHLATKEKQLIGKRMMLRCGGVPLAIRALGDMLRNQSLLKWKDIERSEIWEKEDKYGILPSLELSYLYLPDVYLKRCFSYCAIFKEDEEISKDNLIQLWMAQGFLLPYGEMEATGDRYFDILLDSSLLQDEEQDLLGNVKTCKIHDLVLSLARAVSGGECLNLVEKSNVDETSEARHLSTLRDTSELDLRPEFCNKLRTWYSSVIGLTFNIKSYEPFLVHCRQLRSLCLQRLALNDLPESVSSLKHLRYLDISENEFRSLPIVITKLYHLQTLRIENNRGRNGSPFLWEGVTALVNLRHIFCGVGSNGMIIQKGLGEMTALRTLPPIYVQNNWGGSVSELGSLNNLSGLLKIIRVDLMKVEEAENLHLESKPNVESLVLIWKELGVIKNFGFILEEFGDIENFSQNEGQNEILEAMKPREKLSELEINSYGGTRCPRWLLTSIAGSLHNNIVSLKLFYCPYAKGDLHLEDFTSLRFLALIYCNKLTISFPSHGFECCKFLEELEIRYCYAVEYLPDMSPLTKLHKLVLLNCPKITDKVVDWRDLPNLRVVHTGVSMPTDMDAYMPHVYLSVCDSLQKLFLNGREMVGLPIQVQIFTLLRVLEISFFYKLERLPDWLEHLTVLRWLTLRSLLLLKRLASKRAMQCLSNLKFLDIINCPLLKEQLSKKGAEWLKIAHVPYIECD